MDLDLGREQLVVVGASFGSLSWFDQELPADSVVLVEEPDVIERRGLAGFAERTQMISRLVAAEYQTGLDADALLAREPGLADTRLILPGLEYAVGAGARLAERLGLPGAGWRPPRSSPTSTGCGCSPTGSGWPTRPTNWSTIRRGRWSSPGPTAAGACSSPPAVPAASACN
ncbi:hypothetical protein [Micromonospora sp. DT31]|uniref:hypothetical protein n=1 Tax=Micromonospora sp. DT31 TaxID=3393434 RepID=UPI003CEBFAF4